MKLTPTFAAAALCLAASCNMTMAAAKTAPAKPAAKAAPAALPAAGPEQVAAAERAHVGPYECEFGQKVDVALNTKSPGYVDVSFKKDTYTMKAVLSSTGALRLEDVNGRTLFLQIANKSMLMDVKAGQRLVDGCVHASQREAAAMAATPK